jgi:5'(3')-deoxyribonucleotidase
MKDLLNLLEASDENLPTIYCDLDQVLVNFMKGAEEAIGGKFATADKIDRWKKINQTKGFWANLDWMPNAKRLYKFIERYEPYVLSAYSGRDPNSQGGKMKWLSKNTNWKKSRIKLVKRAQKQTYAKTNGEPNILIDDYIKNINEWEAKGGVGVHHTDVGKTINKLKSLGFK